MTERDLAGARAAHEGAERRVRQARADLRQAGIKAKIALDESSRERGLTLERIAQRMGLQGPALSRLNPQKETTQWKPQGVDAYRAIDEYTGSRFQLVLLRRALDVAMKELKDATDALALAEARADREGSEATLEARHVPQNGADVVVDDVLVDRMYDRVVLDVRVRNAGTQVANITRAVLRITKRRRFLAAYAPSARYDLWIDGDHNECAVAHHLAPAEVDGFLLTLGFAEREIGTSFTAELSLLFNRDRTATSQTIEFDSCFE
ncbi:hypothetical protein [Streptomyces neyagawaensis]|uniref:Uncharacterized protein n=1 Tax=Streptomyces neyagawaensis TaxID=42238 RepID=A0ABV3B5L0_9ACTN